MKKFLFSMFMLMSTQLVYADVLCPPVDLIQKVKFTVADKIPWLAGRDGKSMWMLVSDNFSNRGQTWNVWYNVATSSKDPVQIIKEGMTSLSQKKLISPVKTVERKRNVCIYTLDSDTQTINAFNPPNPAMSNPSSNPK